MEIIDIESEEKINESKTIKKVPILSDQMMATLLLIPPNTEVPAHSHLESDEIHYVISGSGKITIGGHSEKVRKGMLILVQRAEFHYFTTQKEPLVVLTNSPVCEPNMSQFKTDSTQP